MRLLFSVFAICASVTVLLGADNPFVGTWKLNTEKSKFSPGSEIRNMTVTFELDGNRVKVITTGTDRQGKPIVRGGPEGDETPWDGQDHAVSGPGASPSMTLAIKLVNDHTVDVTVKSQGKVINRNHTVISEDGKTMTSTENGVDEKGAKVHKVEIYEKQ
jgi:hypothetical protein